MRQLLIAAEATGDDGLGRGYLTAKAAFGSVLYSPFRKPYSQPVRSQHHPFP